MDTLMKPFVMNGLINKMLHKLLHLFHKQIP